MNIFLDITGPGGGRVYMLDEGGRLLRTSDFSLDRETGFSFDEPVSEDIESCYVSLPVEWLDFRLLELDIADADAARQVLPFELDGLLVEPASEYVMDAIVIRPPSEEATDEQAASGRVFAVYMKKERLRELLDSLNAAGLDPRAVTSIELASMSAKLEDEGVSDLIDGVSSIDEPRRVDLARGELDSPLINMRHGEFAFRGDVRKGLRSLAFTVTLFIAFMLTLSLSFSLNASYSSNKADRLEDQVLGIYGEIFPGQKPSSARGLSYKVRSKLKEMRGKSDSLRSVKALQMLLQLQEAYTEVGEIKVLDVTLDRDAVLLKGEGKDLDSIEKARAAMESFLSEVKITETGKAVSGQTGFTISAMIKQDSRGETR